MRTELPCQRGRRRVMLAAVTLVSAVALAPRMASAEGIFDFFFGGFQKQQRQGSGQANFFTDPFGLKLVYGGLGLMVLGVLVIRKIIDIKV